MGRCYKIRNKAENGMSGTWQSDGLYVQPLSAQRNHLRKITLQPARERLPYGPSIPTNVGYRSAIARGSGGMLMVL